MASRSASEPLAAFDPSLDHFARLGLARRFALDRDDLEERYLDRSKLVHPDRHVGGDSATRRASVEHSAALNAGYRILRDRVARAEYLVKLGGVDLDSSDPEGGAPHPDQLFLVDMIERRDALDELREAGDEDGLETLSEAVEAEQDRLFTGVVEALDAGETADAAAGLVHIRYLRRLANELETALA